MTGYILLLWHGGQRTRLMVSSAVVPRLGEIVEEDGQAYEVTEVRHRLGDYRPASVVMVSTHDGIVVTATEVAP